MSIEERMAVLESRMALVEGRLNGGAGMPAKGAGGGAIASDRDLDSEWGNPIVDLKKDPRDWTGESFIGRRMNECPPEYLDMVANLFDWMADRDEAAGKTYVPKSGKNQGVPTPTAQFKRKDASRARGWAARARNGQAAPAPAQRSTRANTGPAPAPQDDFGPGNFGDDDLPF